MSYDYQAPPESYFPTIMEENDDLRWAIENDPHVVTFWSAVCAFINHEREHGEDPDRVLEFPSWGQWRSIEQHLAAGKKVEAIKLLRASTYAWTQVQPALPPPVPQGIGNEGWGAFMAANALPAWDRRGGLRRSEAKSIIDTLEAAPHWFGNDTNREFNSPYVTCADGGHVPEEPALKFGFGTLGVPRDDAPKSLGELLRDKIAAMRDEPPREDPEKPEHSVWINVYPGNGYATLYYTREAAGDAASSGRIACINITFKEGEGL